ncbi:MAG: hypothetical protein VXW22_00460 [Pseudomonadota bacterium]|jgi:hypothetical protein|nr:hypothetical protein [Pseudomonadota bacterium]
MPDGSSPFGDERLKQGGATAPLGIVGSSVRTLVRQAFAILGLVLIAVAIPIAFVTPLLPIGLPIAILGVVLLGRNSLWGRRWMEGVMERHPRVERFAPNWLMKAVFGREKSTPEK